MNAPMPVYESYAGNPSDGDGRHVAVSVGGVRIAGAVCLRQRYGADPSEMVWTVVPVLRLPGVDGDVLRTFRANDEQHALTWLGFLAALFVAGSEVEPPAEVITEADLADDDQVSAAELDELATDEDAFWAEVRDCCGGRNYWCGHYRQYAPMLVGEAL